MSREKYIAMKEFRKSIESIPKKNRQKFFVDLLKLIEFAHEGDYENFDLER